MAEAAVVKSASDPRQVKRGKQLEKRLRVQAVDRLRAVLATEDGRAVLYALLLDTGLRAPLIVQRADGGGVDANAVVALAGQRTLGVKWEDAIREADPDALGVMEREEAARVQALSDEIKAAHAKHARAMAAARGEDPDAEATEDEQENPL